jgi:hypothetical protein
MGKQPDKYKPSPRKWLIYNRFRRKWIVRIPSKDCVGVAKHICCVSELCDALTIQDAEFEKRGTTYEEMLEVHRKRIVNKCKLATRCRDIQVKVQYNRLVDSVEEELKRVDG